MRSDYRKTVSEKPSETKKLMWINKGKCCLSSSSTKLGLTWIYQVHLIGDRGFPGSIYFRLRVGGPNTL